MHCHCIFYSIYFQIACHGESGYTLAVDLFINFIITKFSQNKYKIQKGSNLRDSILAFNSNLFFSLCICISYSIIWIIRTVSVVVCLFCEYVLMKSWMRQRLGSTICGLLILFYSILKQNKQNSLCSNLFNIKQSEQSKTGPITGRNQTILLIQ